MRLSGHPTADGRSFADLRAGAKLDGVTITSATSIPYAADFTYDILPTSDTGTYFAAGLLIGSTLKETGPVESLLPTASGQRKPATSSARCAARSSQL